MQNIQDYLEKRVALYTGWLRECEDAARLSIEPTSDNGAWPYQWKIGTSDYSRFLGYVIFHGPKTNGSEMEKRQHLCSLLKRVLRDSGLDSEAKSQAH